MCLINAVICPPLAFCTQTCLLSSLFCFTCRLNTIGSPASSMDAFWDLHTRRLSEAGLSHHSGIYFPEETYTKTTKIVYYIIQFNKLI